MYSNVISFGNGAPQKKKLYEVTISNRNEADALPFLAYW